MRDPPSPKVAADLLVLKKRKRGSETFGSESSMGAQARNKQRAHPPQLYRDVSSHGSLFVPVLITSRFLSPATIANTVHFSDSRDYSCAYDFTLMPLYHILAAMTSAQRVIFATSSTLR